MNDVIDDMNGVINDIEQGLKLSQALATPRPDRSIDQWSEDVGVGWRPLIRSLDASLREFDPDYRIDQVKEKFGGLRYYYSSSKPLQTGHDKAMETLVRHTEDASFKICEDCGAPGDTKAINGFWLKTLCPLCREERENDVRPAASA